MQRIKLAEIFRDLPIDFISNRKVFEDASISSISTDSRSLKKDDLFIALAGESFDGHSFVSDAVGKGAAGVVFESGKLESIKREIESSPGVLFIGTPDTRIILGRMAQNYLQRFGVHRIAVTGSAGKTTTKALIHSVLSQRYRVISSIQSYNNDIGVPKTIFNIDGLTEVLVQELGTNNPGEIAYLAGILKPDFALITNIGPAHIGFFGSEENIAREKKEVFNVLDERGTAFANAEDRYFRFLTEGLAARVRSFGLLRGDLYPERIEQAGLGGTEFVLYGERVRLRLPGMHWVLNATAAALVGMELGLTVGEIKRGIEGYAPESGRGTLLQKSGYTIIDESYNANPLSVTAALEHVGGISTAGKKIFVFADMLELGEQSAFYHEAVAKTIMENGIDVLYTLGKESQLTAEACRKAGHGLVQSFIELDAVVGVLQKTLCTGDLVLVKGSRAMRLERVVQALLS